MSEPYQDKVRELTRRTSGRRMIDIIAGLRKNLLGWKAYFGIAQVLSSLRDVDKWIRRKLRCYHWKQWGRSGYRERRRRGVSVREAWNTSKSAHGPWRLSRTPTLTQALPARYFAELGLPWRGNRSLFYRTAVHGPVRTVVWEERRIPIPIRLLAQTRVQKPAILPPPDLI